MGSCLAGDIGRDSEPKIYLGGDTTRGDHVAISNDPGLLVRCPDKGQQIGKRPMGRRPPSFEYSGNPQNECAGANRRDVLCSTRLPADELYGFAIADCPDDAVASARDAEQIEWRTVRKGVRWHEAQPAIAGHRRV